jgi:hypothetical protein
LAYDGIPKRIQKLRCYTNFEALRFAQPIADMGNTLVHRMKAKSATTNGNYVSIHLRFEEVWCKSFWRIFFCSCDDCHLFGGDGSSVYGCHQDMVAFSQCVYEGDEEEKTRLDNAREKSWRGKFNRTGRVNLSPEDIRRDGKCPLTPVEVGMMLRGMGFRNTTPIFLAAGKIYKGEESMEPLRRMFPYLQTKETLLTTEELKQFKVKLNPHLTLSGSTRELAATD